MVCFLTDRQISEEIYCLHNLPFNLWSNSMRNIDRKTDTPYIIFITFFPHGSTSHLVGLVFEIALRHSTLGRNRLDEWWAGRRELYLKTQNTKKQRDIHGPRAGIRNGIASKRTAAAPRLTLCGLRDRHSSDITSINLNVFMPRICNRYIGCSTTLGHNCRKWYPRFLWSKNFI